MRNIATVAIFLVLLGCANSPYSLLNQQYQMMQNDELLAYYYRLQNASGDSDRSVAGMQSQYNSDRFFGGYKNALGNVIVQGMIAGQGQAIRERAVLVRVELERRGWTPAKGLPQQQTTEPQYTAQPETYQGYIEQQRVRAAPAETHQGYTEQQRVRAAPEVVGLKEESKYMVSAEGIAKVSGCTPPNAAMTSKGAGEESFIVACPNGTTLAIRCGYDGCRILK